MIEHFRKRHLSLDVKVHAARWTSHVAMAALVSVALGDERVGSWRPLGDLRPRVGVRRQAQVGRCCSLEPCDLFVVQHSLPVFLDEAPKVVAPGNQTLHGSP